MPKGSKEEFLEELNEFEEKTYGQSVYNKIFYQDESYGSTESNEKDVEQKPLPNMKGTSPNMEVEIVTLYLAGRGFSIDEICHPGKLKAEKEAVIKEINDLFSKQHYSEQSETFGKQIALGQMAILNQAKQIDTLDAGELLDEKNQKILFALHCANNFNPVPLTNSYNGLFHSVNHFDPQSYTYGLQSGAGEMTPEQLSSEIESLCQSVGKTIRFAKENPDIAMKGEKRPSNLHEIPPENIDEEVEQIFTSWTGTYLDKFTESIEELKNADKWMLTGSNQYKEMQKALNEMSQSLQNFKQPYTEEMVQSVKESLDKLQDKVNAYDKHKQEDKRSNSQKEGQRMAAAQKLSDLCKDMRNNRMNDIYEQYVAKPQLIRIKQELKEHWSQRYNSIKSSDTSYKVSWLVDKFTADHADDLRDRTVAEEKQELLAQLVVLEEIRSEREMVKKGMPITDENSVEKLYQKNDDAMLSSIKETKRFQEMEKTITLENIKDFLMNDRVKKLAMDIRHDAFREKQNRGMGEDLDKRNLERANNNKMDNTNPVVVAGRK